MSLCRYVQKTRYGTISLKKKIIIASLAFVATLVGVYFWFSSSSLSKEEDYTNPGQRFMDRKQYHKAIKYFEKELRKLDPNDLEVATMYLNVSEAHFGACNLTKSAQYEQRALKYLQEKEKKLTEDDLELADVYNLLGKRIGKGGTISYFVDFETSMEYLKKALNIQKRKLGDNNPQVAITYYKLGKEYPWHGENEQGLEYLLRAKEILEKQDPWHIALADIYYEIGRIQHANFMQFRVGREYYEKALPIQIKHLGKDSLKVATIYGSIALSYYNEQKYKEAIPYYEKALRIESRKLAPGSKRLGDTKADLAYCKKQ